MPLPFRRVRSLGSGYWAERSAVRYSGWPGHGNNGEVCCVEKMQPEMDSVGKGTGPGAEKK
jgi:hypothetical protein